MSAFQKYSISMPNARTYNIYVPPKPKQPLLPAIIVFHGGGEDISVTQRNWGVDPPNPVPLMLENYLMVFPETDPTLDDKWVHHKYENKRFPEHDLLFLDELVKALGTTPFPTSIAGKTVSADPSLLYVAGFSSGAGMVWQIANSDRVTKFQGFAAVGLGLDPEKAVDYRQRLAGAAPPPIPLIYIMGTADSHFTSPSTLIEFPIGVTRPFYSVEEMLKRNLIPPPTVAATTLIPGSTNMTEVVVQSFTGGAKAFTYVTVINGNHNWPSPKSHGQAPIATHVNATEMIRDFWHSFAGLP